MADVALNSAPSCRVCFAGLQTTFCNLGLSPLANFYPTAQEVAAGAERFYPLHAYVCDACKLVQLQVFETPEAIFSDYAYFSSYSSTMLEQAQRYSEMIIERLSLAPERSFVLEIASNDGYLLKNFVHKGIRVLGIEPAANVARAAVASGVPTQSIFFGAASARSVAKQHGRADLIIGNNVIAHVPNLHDFIEGVRIALSAKGTATFEFPHLLKLIEKVEFDTIYHEHFSYFSVRPLRRAFNEHELEITEIEEIPAHGGSLRVYVRHAREGQPNPSVAAILDREFEAGLENLETYRAFQSQVDRHRDELVSFLSRAKNDHLSVAGYGAPAKATTLLNYCKVDASLLAFTVDLNPSKQNRLLPGTHIPIYGPEKILETRPDIVLILAWNLRDEIEKQLEQIRSWGGRFAVATPRIEIGD